MTPKEAHDLLVNVREEYIKMGRELQKYKQLTNPVDPWKLPLVEQIQKGIKDLALAAGIKQG
jgi:hypothetical protein